jgi:hypothetical protein
MTTKATTATTAKNGINDPIIYECNGCEIVMTHNANHCDECKEKFFPKSAIQSTNTKDPRPKSCRKGVGCRRKGCQFIHECRYGETCRSLQLGSKFKCKYGHDLVSVHLARYGPRATAHALDTEHL